ncbi:uncharacterized protein LOC125501113 isoform X1 [Athalia rosae]|uniref:uncharacterized protein LOC125501113 isoform X1 n=1 Tax=Athalia rosae TaxID=37344 RepID=UPI0020346033|nr:uncharacterized protein LOC125501113 isoform X1 [Athalia rosae]
MEAAWSISIWRFPGNGNSQSSLEARARVGELRGWISAIKNLPREIRTPSTKRSSQFVLGTDKRRTRSKKMCDLKLVAAMYETLSNRALDTSPFKIRTCYLDLQK